jgi:hypothetical protein
MFGSERSGRHRRITIIQPKYPRHTRIASSSLDAILHAHVDVTDLDQVQVITCFLPRGLKEREALIEDHR